MDYVEYFGEYILTLSNYILFSIVWFACNILYYPILIVIISSIVLSVSGYDSKIRFIACYSLYLFWTTVVALCIWPFFIINFKAGVMNSLYGANCLKLVAYIIGIEYELRNGEVLSSKTGTAVIAANHQSFFDVLGMFTKWHIMQKCTAIARKKVFYIWPFGLAAWLAGVVFIDRIPSYEKTFQKINKAAEYVCRERAKLWMFVEGTRNRRPEKLLPFKKGAFRVAICCQIPIIPVVFSPYYFINGRTMYFGKGKIIMEALDPIPTTGLTLNDIDDLMDKVYKVMSAKNDEFREMLKQQNKIGKLPCCKNL